MGAAGLELLPRDFHPVNSHRALAIIMITKARDDMTLAGLLPARLGELGRQLQYWLELGKDIGAQEVAVSWDVVRQLERDMAMFYREADVLLTPAVACVPYGADVMMPEVIDGRDSRASGPEPFGFIANIAWNPSISVPAGLSREGLAVDLQITVRRHRDDIALRIGNTFNIAEEVLPKLRKELFRTLAETSGVPVEGILGEILSSVRTRIEDQKLIDEILGRTKGEGETQTQTSKYYWGLNPEQFTPNNESGLFITRDGRNYGLVALEGHGKIVDDIAKKNIPMSERMRVADEAGLIFKTSEDGKELHYVYGSTDAADMSLDQVIKAINQDPDSKNASKVMLSYGKNATPANITPLLGETQLSTVPSYQDLEPKARALIDQGLSPEAVENYNVCCPM